MRKESKKILFFFLIIIILSFSVSALTWTRPIGAGADTNESIRFDNLVLDLCPANQYIYDFYNNGSFLCRADVSGGGGNTTLEMIDAVNNTSINVFNASWADNVSRLYCDQIYGNASDLCSLNFTSITHLPWNITTEAGTLDDGNIASIQVPEDGFSYNVSEAAGANPLEITVNFTGLNSTLDAVVGRIYYEGGQGHEIQIELWRYDTLVWENYIEFTDTTDFVNFYFPVFDVENHIDANGNASIRFYHVQAGNPLHNFYIDYLVIIEGFTATLPKDHDAFGGRDNPNTNHPWILTQVNTTFNIETLINNSFWHRLIDLNQTLDFSDMNMNFSGIDVQNDLNVTGGINVGTATGAEAGDINLSRQLHLWDNLFFNRNTGASYIRGVEGQNLKIYLGAIEVANINATRFDILSNAGTMNANTKASLAVKTDVNNYAIAIEETGGFAERWILGVNTDGDLEFYDSGDANPAISFIDTFNRIQFYEDANNHGYMQVTGGGKMILFAEDGSTPDMELRTEQFDNAIYIDDSTQRVGIGDTTPNALLHVLEDDTAGTPAIGGNVVAVFQDTASTSSGTEISIIGGNYGTQKVNFGSHTDEDNGEITYKPSTSTFTINPIGGNVDMYITSIGVGIGLPADFAPDGQLDIQPSHSTKKALVIDAKAGQTANLVEVLNGSGNDLFVISSIGEMIPHFYTLESASELTIDAGGEVTITESHHYIDTFEDAATDSLTTINGGASGRMIILRSANSGRDTTLVDGGNLCLSGNFILTDTQDRIALVYSGTDGCWVELFESNNA